MISMHRPRATAAIAAALVLGTSLTAGATAVAASTPATPAKGTPIKFLQTAPIDSPSISFPDFRTGAGVAVASINAAGGVNGHPLVPMYCDDKVIPTVAAQCAESAVTGGAVANVGSFSTMGNAIQPILQNAAIATFGSTVVVPIELTSPTEFPLYAGPYQFGGLGPLMKLKYPAAKTAVVMVDDLPGNSTRISQLQGGVTKAGMTVLATIAVPVGTADLSSIAGQISRANPDIVISGVGANTLVKYWSATQSIGFTKPFAGIATGVSPAVLAQAGPAAAWSNFVDTYPSMYSTVPGAAEFRADMAKYAPGQKMSRDQWVAWVAVKSFAAIAKSIKGPITSKTVLGTLQNVKCFTVLYFKCLNLSKPGPIADAPVIRVTNLFLTVPKNGALVGTKFSTSAV